MQPRPASLFWILGVLCFQLVILTPLPLIASENWGIEEPQSRRPAIRSSTPRRRKDPIPKEPQFGPVNASLERVNDQVRSEIVQEGERKVTKIMLMGKPKDLILTLLRELKRVPSENRELRDAIERQIERLVLLEEIYCVSASSANIKEQPDLQSATVPPPVSHGTPLTKLEERNDWIHVRLRSGETGWILRELVRECPQY